MANSSEAMIRETKSHSHSHETAVNWGCSQLTGVEGRLQSCQPVVLQHMQEGLKAYIEDYEEHVNREEETHGLSSIIKTQEQNFGILMQQS